MQISSLLRVSFVGALVFSPGMPRVVVLHAQNSTDAEIHEKALEVLRQQTGSSVTTGTSVTSSAASETPEQLQERARQVLKQQQSVPQNSAATWVQSSGPVVATDPMPPAPSTAEIHEKALRVLHQQSVPSQPLDQRTREILHNQNLEIARQAEKPRFVPASEGLSPEAEIRAREVLRQQQQELGYMPPAYVASPSAEPRTIEEAPASSAPPVMSSTPIAPPQTSVAAAPVTTSSPALTAPTPLSATVSAPADSSQYSRELEDRARAIILERSQQQSVTTVSVPTVMETAPTPVAPSTPPPPASVQTTPSTAAIHQQALEIFSSSPQETAVPAGPKSKRDRIRDLTELYRADKMTPAEYHQRRAAILAEP